MCVCLFVFLFPNSSETVTPNELKVWGMIPLGVQMVLGSNSLQENKKNQSMYSLNPFVPWKFELNWRSRFEGVNEQTNKQTEKLTDILLL